MGKCDILSGVNAGASRTAGGDINWFTTRLVLSS